MSTLLLVALLAALTGALSWGAGLLGDVERETVSARFDLRGAEPPDDLAVVAIDVRTFDDLDQRWPFPRSLHARMVDRLHRAGARTIVYDVQFTEPSEDPAEDVALFDALGHAGGAVLATDETDGRGNTNVLGGDANLREIGARAGSSHVDLADGEQISHFPRAHDGLESIAVVTAEQVTGRPVSGAGFKDNRAWIDFRGPPGTVPTYSFADVLRGRVPAAALRGRVVVVGATAPTLQDVHGTPVGGDDLMPGAEIQANAIWTVLRGVPLRDAPAPLVLGLILLLALAIPLARLRVGMVASGALAVLLLAALLAGSYAAFAAGWVVPVVALVLTLIVATVGTLVASHLAENRARRRTAWEREVLAERVREATAELRETRLEVAYRLAVAVESRDADTGEHIERMSLLCERVGRALGMSAEEAETLRQASVLHDVGKVGVPDAILQKPGPLNDAEREVMKTHTTIGAKILDGSSAPLIQMARTIALTHHERWDGTGYPAGLRGEDIPLAGRIAAVCDVFDALMSPRPYKDPWTFERALEEIRVSSGRHFDPHVVEVFLPIAQLARDEGWYAEVAPAPDAGEPEAEGVLAEA